MSIKKINIVLLIFAFIGGCLTIVFKNTSQNLYDQYKLIQEQKSKLLEEISILKAEFSYLTLPQDTQLPYNKDLSDIKVIEISHKKKFITTSWVKKSNGLKLISSK